MAQQALQGGFGIGLIGACVAGPFYQDMMVHLQHVGIEAADVVFLCGENRGEFSGEAIHVGPEGNPPSLEGDGVEQVMADDVDRFLQAVEHEAMGVESLLSKTIQHGRALVEEDRAAPERAAGPSRVNALFDDRDRQAAPGQKARGGQPR